jgi:hypothetical protein
MGSAELTDTYTIEGKVTGHRIEKKRTKEGLEKKQNSFDIFKLS